MNFYLILSSIVLGSGAGALYAVSFLAQNTLLFATLKNFVPKRRSFLLSTLNTLSRLFLMGFFWLYILRTPSVSIILVLASFLGSFWTVIMLKKVFPHAKR